MANGEADGSHAQRVHPDRQSVPMHSPTRRECDGARGPRPDTPLPAHRKSVNLRWRWERPSLIRTYYNTKDGKPRDGKEAEPSVSRVL